MTGGDEKFGTGVFDLFGPYPTIVDTLLRVRYSPGAATSTAAVVIGTCGDRFHIVFHTLLDNPARFFIISDSDSSDF